MNTATLRVTPVELVFIDRLVKERIEKLRDNKSKNMKPYLDQVVLLREKIQDAIISF